MIRYLHNGALAFALLSAGFAPAAAPPSAASPAKAEYQPDQVILVREQGKPDRKCVIVSVKKQVDGLTTYQIRALDNGTMMTIHDRVPPAATTGTKAAASNPNAMNGIGLPDDLANKSDAGLPRAKPRTNDPLLNPTLPTQPKPAVVAKPASELEKPRFRLFGRSDKPATPSCTTCQPKQTAAVAKTAATPGVAKSTREPPLARMPDEPLPIAYGPRLPSTAPMARPYPNEPAPLHLYQAPIDPARQALTHDKERIADLKDTLKTALRPSQRMAAAEELCAPSRIIDADIRAAVMLAAQDDPAGVVRAACIRGMSKTGLRDQAFVTLLIACQSDREKSVREEGDFAMRKATKR